LDRPPLWDGFELRPEDELPLPVDRLPVRVVGVLVLGAVT
jgi:hypothetical protein